MSMCKAIASSEIVTAAADLPECLNKRGRFNVTNCPTQLYDTHIWTALFAIDRHFGNLFNPVLNGIRNVGHHLYSLAQVVAFALSLYDMLQAAAYLHSHPKGKQSAVLLEAVHAIVSNLVNFACGEIVLSGQADVKEAFIVAQIQIDLQPIGTVK